MPRLCCPYKDQTNHGAGPTLTGCRTGHHVIPDHCFYYTSGMRGKGDLSGFLVPDCSSYTTADAPVYVLTADKNGGKSQQHGLVHAVFDPIERDAAKAGGNQWTYAEAREAAVKSLVDTVGVNGPELAAELDAYFIDECGLSEDMMIRAGEYGVMTDAPPPRKSPRAKSNNRYSPY